jgi:hypothetical protein
LGLGGSEEELWSGAQIHAHDFNVFIAVEMATLLANVSCCECVRDAMCLIGSATFAFIETVHRGLW